MTIAGATWVLGRRAILDAPTALIFLGTSAFGFNLVEIGPGGQIPEHDESGSGQVELYVILEGAVGVTKDGRISLANAQTERLFGYRADEALGQNVSILMPAPYRERHDSYINHYLRTGERRIIGTGRTVVGLRRDGTTFPGVTGCLSLASSASARPRWC